MAMARGQMPPFEPAEWICTADMASWHQLPRSLAKAYFELFGEHLAKDARDAMAGLSAEEITANPAFREYALNDSRACLRIYQELELGFPERERILSALNRKIASRGMPLDGPLCQTFIDKTEQVMEEMEKFLPWVTEDGRGAEPTSPLALGKYLEMKGVKPPPSTKEDDPAVLIWKANNPDHSPVLDAMTRWRKANKANKFYIGLILRTRPDRRVSTRLLYCGATHTKRFSGTGGINFHGIPRDEVEGTSAKRCLKAPEGRVIVSADLSQIEPRVLAYLVGDMDFLGLVRGGIDLYEAHGRASGLYNHDEPMKDLAPEMRHLCKARVLGLGYGCGFKKFGQVAEALTGGKLRMTEAEAKKQVSDYRKNNPLIVEQWKALEDFVREQAKDTPECVVVTTRDGAPIRYFNVQVDDKGEITAQKVRGQGRSKLYGGLLMENLVQCQSRQIFSDAIIRAEAAGLPVCLHVHDSITVEVAEQEGQAALDLLISILTEEPTYMPGLPLAAEGEIKTHY
jgi:DNA polymerase